MKPRARPAFIAATIAAAFLAATALPGEEIGINVGVVWIAVVLAIWIGTRKELGRTDTALLVLAAMPPAVSLLRSADWVVALQLPAAALALAVAAGRARTWDQVLSVPAGLVSGLPRGGTHVAGPALEKVDLVGPAVRPVLRTSGLTAFLLLVFGGLFASADAAFASLAREWLDPDLDVGLLPARLVLFAAVTAFAGSVALLGAKLQDRDGNLWTFWDRPPFKLKPTEWKLALGALDLLFASFVAVQLAVLFGGRSYVLKTTGLTYAEYAREGFFQLVCVAVLTLVVIAGTMRFAEVEKDRGWVRLLLGALCLLTLVILASALTRMNLYQEAFGFTRLRLMVDMVIYLLAACFVLLIVAGSTWDGSWLPRTLVAVALVGVFVFGLSNPDGRIAERNIARFRATGDVDIGYLSGLSPDAVPALATLDHPEAGCVIENILTRAAVADSFWSMSLARARAREVGSPPCRS